MGIDFALRKPSVFPGEATEVGSDRGYQAEVLEGKPQASWRLGCSSLGLRLKEWVSMSTFKLFLKE